MRIDNPTIEGALTLPADAGASGSFSGSFEGDGSNLTGITATDLDIDQFGDDLTGNTLAGTDKMILSDGGTEGRVNVSQLATPLAGTGLEANAGTVRIATAAAGDGLSGGGGSALAVNVDDSTIETNADTLRVKDSGITNDKLTNSSVAIGDQTITLGAAATTELTGLTNISADTGSFVLQLFESSSTIITSGSNIFGDKSNDTQQFTGSILQTGSFIGEGPGATYNNAAIVTGSAQINHDSTTGFVANEHIDHSGVSITAGDGLTGGGTIASSRTINVGAGTLIDVTADAVNVDLSELSTSTSDGDGDYFVVVDTSNAQRKLTKANIAISGFNNDSGYTTYTSNQATNTTSAVTFATVNTGQGANELYAMNQDVETSDSVQFNSIGVNTAPSGVAGAILATNDVVAFATSDERLKENFEPIGSAVEKVEQLTGYTYNWIPMEGVHVYGDMKDVGVIAQEVEKVLPELVSDRENGYKAVKYDKLTAVLIQAVKELSARVKELESK